MSYDLFLKQYVIFRDQSQMFFFPLPPQWITWFRTAPPASGLPSCTVTLAVRALSWAWKGGVATWWSGCPGRSGAAVRSSWARCTGTDCVWPGHIGRTDRSCTSTAEWNLWSQVGWNKNINLSFIWLMIKILLNWKGCKTLISWKVDQGHYVSPSGGEDQIHLEM